MQYMVVTLIARAKEVRGDGSIVEIVIWELPESLPPSSHRYKSVEQLLADFQSDVERWE